MSLIEILVLVAVVIYIIVSAYFRLEPRIAIAIALILLVSAAIVLVRGNRHVAEQLGVYAFYLMGAGVLLLFIRYIRKGSEENK